MYDDLVKRLRECRNMAVHSSFWWDITTEAADAIEDMSREYDSIARSLNEACEMLRKRPLSHGEVSQHQGGRV